MEKKNFLLSIVVPVFNEEECIDEFKNKVFDVMKANNINFEIIFVDDGSSDNSLEILKEFQAKDDRIKVLSFSRNFGHQIALTAGMDYVSGDCVITMDGDLQHPPELIPQMLELWQKGNDIVYTVRQQTEDAGTFKKITSKLFYKIINYISEIDLNYSAADFRLMDKKVLTYFKQLNERSRMIRGLISWLGFKSIGLDYTAPKRFAGKTKYSFKKMFIFALDGMTSFSIFPLRIASLLGIVVSIFSFLYVLYIIYARLFTDSTIQGWTSILFSLLFLGGIQLITIGIIGEYIGRIYIEVKNRPIYVLKDKLGFEGK